MATKRLNIIIAGRTYPVTVEESEVSVIQEIEKNINKKINEFTLTYKTDDKIDIITLILLNCSLDNYNLNNKKSDNKDILDLISDIENSVNKVL